jgi:regulatory protein
VHDADATAALEKLRAAVARVERGEADNPTSGPPPPDPPTDPPTGPPPPDPAAGADEPAKDPYAVARAIVLRQLTNAPKTRQQLRDVLAKRECPPDVAEAVLDRMAEVGLVDDAAYAQMLVRSKQTGRGLARRALSHELRTKGVDDQTAADVLEAIDPDQERSRARQLVDKKLASMHGLEASVQTRRLAGMLARKGYAGDMAWGVIRDALADSPEHQRD